MTIKITIDEKNIEKEIKPGMLVKLCGGCTIIFVTSVYYTGKRFKGVVISECKDENYFQEGWWTGNFEPFHGSITLTQE